jgi:hypothetical protein
VLPPPGKMVPGGGETEGGPRSEAVAEAADGSEAEVTTVAEVTEVVPATSLVAEGEWATTTDSALFLYTMFIRIDADVFFFLCVIYTHLSLIFFWLHKNVCSAWYCANQCQYISYSITVNKKP